MRFFWLWLYRRIPVACRREIIDSALERVDIDIYVTSKIGRLIVASGSVGEFRTIQRYAGIISNPVEIDLGEARIQLVFKK